jgi:ribosomal protein L20
VISVIQPSFEFKKRDLKRLFISKINATASDPFMITFENLPKKC